MVKRHSEKLIFTKKVAKIENYLKSENKNTSKVFGEKYFDYLKSSISGNMSKVQ